MQKEAYVKTREIVRRRQLHPLGLAEVAYGTLAIGTMGCSLTALVDLSFVLLGRLVLSSEDHTMKIKHCKNAHRLISF